MNVITRSIPFGIVFMAIVSEAAAAVPGRERTGKAVQPSATLESLSRMPLAFTENRDQWDERVRFRASAGGVTLWFCRDGITYQFTHRVPRSKAAGSGTMAAGIQHGAPFDLTEPDSIESVVVHAAFVGADPGVELVGENLLEYRCNYFLGNDPAKWRTNVPNYAAVVYQNVYPGVDLRYLGKGGALTCSYTAASEPDLAQVKFSYEGNAAVTETGLGQFRVEAPWGAVFEPLTSRESAARTGEAKPAGTSRTASLSFVYSTYLGGNGGDVACKIAVDASGAAYVTGATTSANFPMHNPYDGTYVGAPDGKGDVFVTKLAPAGNALVYSTFLGGSMGEAGWAIAVDASGAAYVTGWTQSPDFPMQNPYQTGYLGDNSTAFVTKLTPAGNALAYSTYLGGGDDVGVGIAVDASGAAYIAVETESEYFPMQNPYDGTFNGQSDIAVTKFTPAGNVLVYSTFLGGRNAEYGSSVAVDANGVAYVVGGTSSTDFPTTQGAFDVAYNGGDSFDGDAFVAKLSAGGNMLLYSTFLGGSGGDIGGNIAVDAFGAAYVVGGTSSADFPTTQGAFDVSYNGGNPVGSERTFGDVFVSKLAPAGNALTYSTFLGGSGEEVGYGITVDASGAAFVTGVTTSADLPMQSPYDGGHNGAQDAFVTKLAPAGNVLEYSTFLGGGSADGAVGIAVDQAGSAYVTGVTTSSDFPTQNPYDGSYNGGEPDAFVAKFGSVMAAVFEPQSSDVVPGFALQQNMPNPFNASTTIRFSLETGGPVELAIYNILGQRVHVHREPDLPPGSYSYEWDGRDQAGRHVPSGVYLYRLTASRFAQTRKMALLK